jgi:hypothetical protein
MNAMEKFANGNDTDPEGFIFPSGNDLLNLLEIPFQINQDAGIKDYAHLPFFGIGGWCFTMSPKSRPKRSASAPRWGISFTISLSSLSNFFLEDALTGEIDAIPRGTRLRKARNYGLNALRFSSLMGL